MAVHAQRKELNAQDELIVEQILQARRELHPNDRLVLKVNIKPTEGEEPDEYVESVLWEAPGRFRKQLENAISVSEIAIEGTTSTEPLPEWVEIVIPPNIFPKDAGALGDNTTASREALFVGDVRQYLDTYISLLQIIPSGLFLGQKLNIHPSSVVAGRVEQVSEILGVVPQVQFRAVKVI